MSDFQVEEIFKDPVLFAVTILRDRIMSLPDEDRGDMRELVPLLIHEDEEECEAAIVAMCEILDQDGDSIIGLD